MQRVERWTTKHQRIAKQAEKSGDCGVAVALVARLVMSDPALIRQVILTVIKMCSMTEVVLT